MKKIINIAVFVLLGMSGFAQNTNGPVNAQSKPAETKPALSKKKSKLPPKDGFYNRAEIDSNVNALVEYAPVREEDVFFAKRIWREIDLRDTVNSILKSPKSRLMDVILVALKNGEMDAYAPNDSLLNEDDAFKTLLTPDSALGMALGFSNITKNGKVERIANKYPQDYNPELYLKFRIKEDWILDVKRSIFEPRIVGIAPLKLNEESKSWQPIFWIYYPDARDLFSRKRLINPNNDASSLTFDDLFIRRLFASYIVKETNPGDNKIKDIISDPKDRLYESERIKRSVLDYEQGLWEY